MATAAATIVSGFKNQPGRINTISNLQPGTGVVISQINAGAFNASTNPNGVRNFTNTDTIVLAEVTKADTAYPSDLGQVRSELLLRSVKFVANKTWALGTAANVALKVVRRANSSLFDVTIATITEASGFFVIGTLVGTQDINIVLEEGDKLVLVPDAAMDTGADATAKVNCTIEFERLITGGRLTAGTAGA